MKLTAILKTDKIPANYNMSIVSITKEILKASNEEFYEQTYFFEGKQNKVFKDLTFSVYVEKPSFSGDTLYTGGRIFLNF